MGRRSQDREQWEDFKNKWSLIDSQQKHGNLGPAVAAAAKSPQSCPTLCEPIDGSPEGSSVPGILQARIACSKKKQEKCKMLSLPLCFPAFGYSL